MVGIRRRDQGLRGPLLHHPRGLQTRVSKRLTSAGGAAEVRGVRTALIVLDSPYLLAELDEWQGDQSARWPGSAPRARGSGGRDGGCAAVRRLKRKTTWSRPAGAWAHHPAHPCAAPACPRPAPLLHHHVAPGMQAAGGSAGPDDLRPGAGKVWSGGRQRWGPWQPEADRGPRRGRGWPVARAAQAVRRSATAAWRSTETSCETPFSSMVTP
jgi:hypothetical protein